MLKRFVATGVLAFAAAGVMMTATPASAGIKMDGDGGLVSGNEITVPISVPVNVCGNGVAVLGEAEAGCEGGASVGGGHEDHDGHDGHDGHDHDDDDC